MTAVRIMAWSSAGASSRCALPYSTGRFASTTTAIRPVTQRWRSETSSTRP
ncbi:Uncharacterised protein [Bordetella pertussis]|nr:Uncharacterised protein [Bordetella pertussis]CFW46094.1 Uncharacterised protein [Bordetella pertussis]